MKGTIHSRKAAYLANARPQSSNPFTEIITNTEIKSNTHRRQTLVKLVEEFDSASKTPRKSENNENELSPVEEAAAPTADHPNGSNGRDYPPAVVDDGTKSKVERAMKAKLSDLVGQLKHLIGDFDDNFLFVQASAAASKAAESGTLNELLMSVESCSAVETTSEGNRRRLGSKVRFSSDDVDVRNHLAAGEAIAAAGYRRADSPHMIQKQPFSSTSSNHSRADDEDGSTTVTSGTPTTVSALTGDGGATAKGTVAAIRRSRDLDQLAERLSNVPSLAHTLPVVPGPGGINSLTRSRGSRYSVGMNRFSTTATKLSMDTLNYVSGSRFLTHSMRMPSTALMSTLDPRFVSPSGKQPSLAGTPLPAIADAPGSGTPGAGDEWKTFAEFCVVGINEEVLSGRQQLERQSLQPTGISYRYPATADPVVANLQEYCFPYGARLQYVNRKGLEKTFNDVNTMQYQILQFTDAHCKVHYATCIITVQPLDNVSEQLRANLEELQVFSAASDIIKRYYRHFQYKKQSKFKKSINDAWAQNISKSRNTSLGSTFSADNHAAVHLSAAASSAKTAKSTSKSLFKALNPFRSKKHKSQKAMGASAAAAVPGKKGEAHHHHHHHHHNNHHWLGLGKAKHSFSSQSTDVSDDGAGGRLHGDASYQQHHQAALTLAAQSSDEMQSIPDGTTISSSQQGGMSPINNKRFAVNARASMRFSGFVTSPSSNADSGPIMRRERSLSDGGDKPSGNYSDKFELARNPSSPALIEGSTFSSGRQSVSLQGRGLLRQRSRSFNGRIDDNQSLQYAEHVLEDDLSSMGSEMDLLRGMRSGVGSSLGGIGRVEDSQKTVVSSITASCRCSNNGDENCPPSLRDALNNSAKVAVITERAYCFISDKPLHPVFFQILEVIVQKERQRALDRCAMIMHSSYFNQNKKAGQASTAAAAAVTAAAAAASAQNNSVRRELFSAPDSAQQNKARGAAPTEKQQLPVPSLFRTYSEMHSFHNDREAFLKHIRKFDLSVLLVPPHMRRRTLSCDSSGSRKGSRRELDLSLHAYVKNFTVSTRILSLKEWTSALLFSLIPSELIVKVLSLLLQEQSLLVFGSHSGLVTAITTAFAQLLQPFVWEGIFVPLLPTAAYEALDAPVPYIIGIASSTRPAASMIASTAGVLRLDDFVNHGELYVPTCFDDTAIRVTIASMDQQRRSSAEQEAERLGSLRFFDSPCAVTDDAVDSSCERTILMEPSQCSQLKELNKIIAYHAGKISESSRQFSRLRMRRHSITNMMKGVLFHMSSESLRSLRTVLRRILEHNKSLCGEVITQPGGYKKFGVVNSQTGWFEFLPELFMEPLKTRLKFQESVINTQLFVSFMDQQRVDYEACNSARRFLGEWIYFRVLRLKKRCRRRRSSLKSCC